MCTGVNLDFLFVFNDHVIRCLVCVAWFTGAKNEVSKVTDEVKEKVTKITEDLQKVTSKIKRKSCMH